MLTLVGERNRQPQASSHHQSDKGAPSIHTSQIHASRRPAEYVIPGDKLSIGASAPQGSRHGWDRVDSGTGRQDTGP